jgi:hypothetical protein
MPADPEMRNAGMSDPEERENPEPGKPDGGDKRGRETMWAAVVAALIALLAYVIPRPSSAPVAAVTTPVASTHRDQHL